MREPEIVITSTARGGLPGVRRVVDRTFAISITALALLNAASAASSPFVSRHPSPLVLGLCIALSLMHAGGYWFGASIRRRVGAVWWTMAQATVAVAIGLSGPLYPFTFALVCVLTAAAVIYCDERWGAAFAAVIGVSTLAAIGLATANTYKATTNALLLVATALVTYTAVLIVRRIVAAAQPKASTRAEISGDADQRELGSPVQPLLVDVLRDALSARESEVLNLLTAGASNREIADQLSITERTVKAHLGSIYRKLNVRSRTAAVALTAKRASEMSNR